MCPECIPPDHRVCHVEEILLSGVQPPMSHECANHTLPTLHLRSEAGGDIPIIILHFRDGLLDEVVEPLNGPSPIVKLLGIRKLLSGEVELPHHIILIPLCNRLDVLVEVLAA